MFIRLRCTYMRFLVSMRKMARLPNIANCICGKIPAIRTFGLACRVVCDMGDVWVCWAGPADPMEIIAIQDWNKVMKRANGRRK